MKRWSLILKVAVSLGFIAMLAFTLDMNDLLAQARKVHAGYLAASVVFSYLMVAASAWKWWYILKMQGNPLTLRSLFRWYFIGYFYSNLLPSNVGGDVARAWLAGRQCGSGSAALISVFIERFTGSLVLLTLGITLPFAFQEFWPHPTVWPVMLMAGGLLAGLVAVMVFGRQAARSNGRVRLAGVARRWLRADRPGRMAALWERLAGKVETLGGKADEALALFQRQPRVAAGVMGLTVLHYAMVVGNVLLGYLAFGFCPSVGGIAAILPVAMLVGMIPISLGNLGIAEGSYVWYFGLIGVSGELTLAMGLLLRAKIILLGLTGMVIQMGERVSGSNGQLANADDPAVGGAS
ncbi:MAG: flippase-like domain-containing protein [Lentisphaerae bacterium]|jgi:uncharacterized protein (TIRG00374 family)|nr:flippase-like domain-containing protein [Lentisphaerota bacterium]